MHLFDIAYLIHTYGYWGIFLIVFLESGLIFFLPGDSLLFTAGILAAGGVLGLGRLVPAVFIATFAGGIFGYAIGQNIERLRTRSALRKILRQDHIDRTRAFFDRYGRGAVVFSRFVPIVRTFLPMVAGMVRMPYGRFARYSLAGAALWSATVILAGYFLGQSFPWIERYMTLVIAVVVLLSLAPLVFHFFRKER